MGGRRFKFSIDYHVFTEQRMLNIVLIFLLRESTEIF